MRTYVAVPCVQSVAKNELGLRLILFHNVKQLAIAEMECSTHGTLCVSKAYRLCTRDADRDNCT